MRLIEILSIEANLEESADGCLRMKIPFLTVDVPTANKRLYPLKVVQQAVAELKKKLSNGLAYGSTRHPKEGLEVDDVSHGLEDIELEGKQVVATVKIFPTQKGRNLLTLLRHGGKVGVSARGFGEVQNEGGTDIVKPGYSLAGVDFCLAPASGLYADAGMVCESAPFDGGENDNTSLTEKDLDARFWNAVRFAGYTGTREDYEATQDEEGMELLGLAKEKYRLARLAGYDLPFEKYIDDLASKE